MKVLIPLQTTMWYNVNLTIKGSAIVLIPLQTTMWYNLTEKKHKQKHVLIPLQTTMWYNEPIHTTIHYNSFNTPTNNYVIQ